LYTTQNAAYFRSLLFEENGVHDFGGEGHFENFTFEILVDGVKVNHAADRKAGD